jgi:hypothetical protein
MKACLTAGAKPLDRSSAFFNKINQRLFRFADGWHGVRRGIAAVYARRREAFVMPADESDDRRDQPGRQGLLLDEGDVVRERMQAVAAGPRCRGPAPLRRPLPRAAPSRIF